MKLLAKSILIFFYLAFVEGFLIYKLYHWFVEKQFSLPHLSYGAAVGLNMFFSVVLMRYKTNYYYKGTEVKQEADLDYPLTLPWIALGMAYLILLIIKHF